VKPADGVATMSTLVRGGAMTLGGALLGRVAGMAQSIVIARGLDPHRLGVFAILNYVLALGGAIVDLGVPVAATKLVAEFRVAQPAALRRIVGILTALSLVLAAGGAVALLVASAPLARFYREPELASLFRLAAALLFVSLVGAFLTGAVQGFRRIEALAAVTAVKAVVALGATLLLLPSFGLVGVIAASIAAELIAWPLSGRPLRQALVAAPASGSEPLPAAPLLARALALSVPVVLNGLVIWGGAWFVRSYLARTTGYEAVGYFHVADASARLLLLLPSAVAVPFLPAVSESIALGREATSAMVEGGLRLTLLAVAPAGAFLCLAAEPVLSVVYGDVYAAAAASLTSVLVLAAGLQALGVMIWSTLVGAGRTWAGFGVQAGGQLTLVALTVVLVRDFGLAGIAVAAVAAALVTAVLGLAAVRVQLGARLSAVRGALTVAVLGWLAAATFWVLGATGWLPATGLAAAIVVCEFQRLAPEERRWVLGRLGLDAVAGQP
jgi:O-antigen/teichoic acid export membrane protein